MKKKILLIFIMFLCCSMIAFADDDKNLGKISKDKDIIEAVKIMNNPIGANSYGVIMGNNPFKKVVIIEYKDLSEIGTAYKDYDALGYSNKKQLYIYINPKHKHEIPEALCSLLTGMAVYNDSDLSKSEISYANALEGASWGYFEETKPQLKLIDSNLIKRERSLMKLYDASPQDGKYITDFVNEDSRYSGVKTESKNYSYANYRLKIKNLYDLYKKHVKEVQADENADITTLYKLYSDNVSHLEESADSILSLKTPKTVQQHNQTEFRKPTPQNITPSTTSVSTGYTGGSPTPILSYGHSGSAKNNKQTADNYKEPDFKPYMKDLQRRIKYNWHPPKGNESRKVIILFKIAKNGQLLSCRVYKSSGLPSADMAALNAVKKTAPFRPLPSDYKGSNIEIQFTFDYNVFGGKL